MEDPYSNRKNSSYKEFAKECRDLDRTCNELKPVMWGLLGVVLFFTGLVLHELFLT